jgi:hypothetical protein
MADGRPVLSPDDPIAVALVRVVKGGDVGGLTALLAERPELARAVVADGGCDRSPLHLLTDWPGQVANGPEIVRLLVASGAEVDARAGAGGTEGETPLHWAASSDDLAALDALLDAGADIDAGGAVIAGGPPLADAVAFGQWRAARRLVERGARVDLREAAALGLVDVVERHLTEGTGGAGGPDALDQAFWYACHGGQPATAEVLADRGAALDRPSPWDGLTPLAAAERTAGELDGDDRTRADAVVAWLRRRVASAD